MDEMGNTIFVATILRKTKNMIGETYELIPSPEFQYFAFISEGPKGNIPKAVVYNQLEPGVFNVGFGDYKQGRIQDRIVSNNKDMVKVLNTVASTIYIFTEKHPECTIHIQPVDESRSFLYHTIFKRRLEEAIEFFSITGMTADLDWETFDPDKKYLAFRLKRTNFT